MEITLLINGERRGIGGGERERRRWSEWSLVFLFLFPHELSGEVRMLDFVKTGSV